MSIVKKLRNKAGDEETGGNKHHRCDKCGGELFYPNRADPVPRGNFIVGRSRIGGYICRDCYEKGETFDYRDKAFQDFRERHTDDNWNVILRMSYALRSAPKADYADFMAFLKAESKKGAFGKLPYDPAVRERPDYEPGMAG